MSWIADFKDTDYGKRLIAAGVVQVHWTITASGPDAAAKQHIISAARYYGDYGSLLTVEDSSGLIDVTLFDLVPEEVIQPGVISVDLYTYDMAWSGFIEDTDIDAYLMRDYIERRNQAVVAPKINRPAEKKHESMFDFYAADPRAYKAIEPAQLEDLYDALREYLWWQQYVKFFKYWFPSAAKVVFKPDVWYDGDKQRHIRSENVKIYNKRGEELMEHIIDDLDKQIYWLMMPDSDKEEHIEWYMKHRLHEGLPGPQNASFLKTLSPIDDYINGLFDLPFEWDDDSGDYTQPETTVDLLNPPAIYETWKKFNLFLKS